MNFLYNYYILNYLCPLQDEKRPRMAEYLMTVLDMGYGQIKKEYPTASKSVIRTWIILLTSVTPGFLTEEVFNLKFDQQFKEESGNVHK